MKTKEFIKRVEELGFDVCTALNLQIKKWKKQKNNMEYF